MFCLFNTYDLICKRSALSHFTTNSRFWTHAALGLCK